MKVRVLSYNIHKGLAFGNFRFILSDIRKAIRSLDADIVMLQEVQGIHEKRALKFQDWPECSQIEFLSEEFWPYYVYGDNAHYSHGHHGNAIMSKYPINDFENIDVSVNRFERRGLLKASIQLPEWDHPLQAVSLHLNLLERDRRRQAKALIQEVIPWIATKSPIVIGGDFNDWNFRIGKFLEEQLAFEEAYHCQVGRGAKTYPSAFPMLPLDRLYLRGFEVEKVHYFRGLPWVRLSDHLPVMADLKTITDSSWR